MTDSWQDLLMSNNPELQQLGKDLVLYSIVTTGFKTAPNGFIGLVPNTFWKSTGFVKTFKEIINGYRTRQTYDIDQQSASRYVVRSLYSEPGFLKFTPKSGENIKVGKNMKNPDGSYPEYIKGYDNGKHETILYQNKGEGSYYKKIQPLGEQFKYVEFFPDGDAKSKHPKHNKLPNTTKKDVKAVSEVVKENKIPYKSLTDSGKAISSIISSKEGWDLLSLQEQEKIKECN
jgi:hypothetical protein